MSHHSATVLWDRGDDVFTGGRYSRAHLWQFDGGVSVTASAAPDVVPLPFSRADAVDPEEAFVAALASCHMLFFLDLARQAGFVVDSYRDQAVGEMDKTGDGGDWMQTVHLYPKAAWQGVAPDSAALSDLHHRAHKLCFIANSVKSEIITHLD
jgi:organic hydroperoxide reductase OsmC/OhrA